MEITYRYSASVIRILRILSLLSFILLAALPSWGMLYTNELASSSPDEIIDTDKKEVQELVDPVKEFDYDGTDFLKKNAVEEINELIKNYYKAQLELDMDTLESLVSDIDRINYSMLQAQLKYIESIDNIICYSVEGSIEGTYRVYVYRDLKLRGIDTPAPSLSAFYVTMSSDGNYIIYLSDIDSDTQEFIDETNKSEDVIILKALVDERMNSALSKDAKLKEFYDQIDTSINNSSKESGADAVSGSAITEE